MRKRGKQFKGQVFGNARQAEAQRAALREVNTETIAMKIRMSQEPEKLDRSQIVGIASGARLALVEVRLGKANDEGVGWLVNASNMALIIAQLGLGEDYLDDIKAAQLALVRMLERHAVHKRFALDGPGLTACDQMLDVHQAQLESEDMTDQLMLQAISICHERVKSGQVMEVNVDSTPDRKTG